MWSFSTSIKAQSALQSHSHTEPPGAMWGSDTKLDLNLQFTSAPQSPPAVDLGLKKINSHPNDFHSQNKNSSNSWNNLTLIQL